MPEEKTIVRWLVGDWLGGDPYWRVAEPPSFQNVLAYGWSDGSVTWKP